jgi:hypothetical protein
MPNSLLLALSLIVVGVTSAAVLLVNQNNPRPPSKNETDTAINQAKLVYNQKKLLGDDLSKGPCLSNALMPGWVLDIAHNPREDVDNDPANQCAAYIQGSAKHVVELDVEGNLIRVK